MKKVLLAALALFTFTSAMALDNEPKPGLTFQGQVGMNISNIKGSIYDTKPGANLGFYGQYMLEKAHGTYIFAGLNYGMKGGKTSYNVLNGPFAGDDINEKVNLHYLNIPIHIGFQYNIIPELGVFADFGPYMGVAPGGRKVVDYVKDIPDDYHYNVLKHHDKGEYVDGPGIQRFDWGLGFRFGAEYNQHYSLNIGLDWGLTDILRDSYRSQSAIANHILPKYKNFNAAITLGYRF